MKKFDKFPLKEPVSEFLKEINSPKDLKKLNLQQLNILADELREFLLYSVSQSGGHFGAGLGAIELTIALHSILNLPDDKIVWDTGHQAYPHKILTGRKDKMHLMRKLNGIAAFPSITESAYDAMSVGHSSTSISAALGMNEANLSKDNKKNVFAVIGDGAMTAGIAFEAMMHAGHLDNNLKIILNDNDMSISKNKGGLSDYLAKIWASKSYKKLKSSGKSVLSKLPYALHISRNLKDGIKSAIMPGNLFEDIGINYIGPIDGHDIELLQKTIKRMMEKDSPYLLHIITKKGAGFIPAEEERIKFHAISKIEPEKNSSKPKFQDIFGDWLCDKAETDKSLVGITPAMKEGSGMVNFEKEYPERFYDVAIAEQHSVTFAAGLSLEGLKPVVAIYSTFLQRGYDQFIHDVCLENIDVTFAIDRAGIVGEDGPTHTGSFDISFMRCIPNIVISCPSNEHELWHLLNICYEHKGPAAIRYPRGSGIGVQPIPNEVEGFEIGKAKKIKDGQSVCILNFGVLMDQIDQIAEKKDYTLYDMRFIKPIDQDALEHAMQHETIITLEDNTLLGGCGSAIGEKLHKQKFKGNLLSIGLKDEFPAHGSRNEILRQNGLDEESIQKTIDNFLRN
ncbi:1-deoxy-D-xylulose-5-phosphate synthase [SAR86 cluster bacterium]|nr:1-deoxy-D-xylulose-5-phosphate synthase [SAR86 cluster bacterium]